MATEPTSRPGPPPPPRCPECGANVGYTGHAPTCRRGQEQAVEQATYRAIQKAVAAHIEERRQDKAFMERLHRNIEKHRDLLDLLAEDD